MFILPSTSIFLSIDPEEVKTLYYSNCTQKDIALKYGINGSQVRLFFKRNNIRARTIGERNKLRAEYSRGEKHWRWKREGSGSSGRYTQLTIPNPIRNKYIRIREHRKIIEDYYEIKLGSRMVVHHSNGDKADNTMGNLRLMTNKTNNAHMSMHLIGNKNQSKKRILKEKGAHQEKH